MRIASVFSQAGLGLIAGGLVAVSLAGAEPVKTGVGAGPPAVNAPTPPAPTAAVAPQAPAAASAEPARPVDEGGEQVPPAAPATAPPAVPSTASAATPPKPSIPPLTAAKTLFSAVTVPTQATSRAIGGYAKGCLAGGQALPVDGPAWQVMRLSRNRNWGHPKLVAMVERLANDAKAKDGWPGLLVGDLSQPRGGPMSSGHASHQVGLDVDIWLTPMPDRVLPREERETLEAASVLSEDGFAVTREKWTDAHTNMIKRAASYPEVERVLVHPAIKQVLCYAAKEDRGWLAKVRPYWGHDEHIHVRISCPAGSGDCKSQPPPPGDDGCGKEIEDWMKLLEKIKPEPSPIPFPSPPAVEAKDKPKGKQPLTLVDLPPQCRPVLAYGNPAAAKDIAEAVAVESGAAAKLASAQEKSSKAALTASAVKLGGPKVPMAKDEKSSPGDKKN